MSAYYQLVPIHKRQDLLDETIRLINHHWPKSRAERLSILGTSSKSDLPISLILTYKRKEPDMRKETLIMNDIFFERQNADVPARCTESGRPINVLAHLRLVKVPAEAKACFIESMIVHHEFRGKGIGSFVIKQVEKYCEEVLKLKCIFLSTYDSGEFYMKIGFHLTSAICVYGNGEVNTVSKKIYLRKDLNYTEPEVEEVTEEKEVYDPTKNHNYNQQKQMACDIILKGFPFKIDRAKVFVDRLCDMLEFPSTLIRYFYSFELHNRQTSKRSFHLMISAVTEEAKIELLSKLKNFGVMCFQNFFDKPVDECDNTLIRHSQRLTNLNYILLKELQKLKNDRWIAEFKFENYQFHANQNDEWIIVKNIGVVEYLRTPEIPDIPDETIDVWDSEEEDQNEKVTLQLEKLKNSFKTQENDNWWNTLRRPSQIDLEPLYIKKKISFESIPEEESSKWVDKVRNSHDAMTLGIMIDEF